MDLSTVSALVAEAQALFPTSGRLRVDLSGVELANSAGLALLLEWMDLARSRHLDLRYLHLPSSLERIAAISNLGALLPVEPATRA